MKKIAPFIFLISLTCAVPAFLSADEPMVTGTLVGTITATARWYNDNKPWTGIGLLEIDNIPMQTINLFLSKVKLWILSSSYQPLDIK